MREKSRRRIQARPPESRTVNDEAEGRAVGQRPRAGQQKPIPLLVRVDDEVQRVCCCERLLAARPAPRLEPDRWARAWRVESERDQIAEKFSLPRDDDFIGAVVRIDRESATPRRRDRARDPYRP